MEGFGWHFWAFFWCSEGRLRNLMPEVAVNLQALIVDERDPGIDPCSQKTAGLFLMAVKYKR
ncbi:hypothetical protein DSO57_1002845 [Entomophthora muscae]|uniref:Uncharacterized protein n=1 Tax=Entomophthora muscae TaxID=34485 RepID=A0ACC2RZW8_9FUNG|nr:hypothetical protein DSO57_1002845 [Entomophthora muscae]